MYETVANSRNNIAKRPRRVMRLVFAPELSIEAIKSLMLGIAVQCLQREVDLMGVLIFGYDSIDSEAHHSFNRGRLVLTRDGKGWTGNGKFFSNHVKDKKGFASFQERAETPETLFKVTEVLAQ